MKTTFFFHFWPNLDQPFPRKKVHYSQFLKQHCNLTGVNTEKVDIDSKKGEQIRVATKKIATPGWGKIMIMKYKQAIHFFFLIIFLSLCLYYVTHLIKKLDYVYWSLLLLMIKFGHAQIRYTNVKNNLHQPI